MKKIVLVLAITLVPISLIAQDEDVCAMSHIDQDHIHDSNDNLFKATNLGGSVVNISSGRLKPAQDTLRVLMVYIRFEDDNQSMSYWNTYPNPNNVWEVEDWMENSIDSLASTSSNNYMNITNYFRTMSHGKYMVLGDVVHVEAPSMSQFSTNYGTLPSNPDNLDTLGLVNKWVFEFLDGEIDLNRYDNYDYVSSYSHDKISDGIVDMAYMMYRTPGAKHFAGTQGGNFGGIAALYTVDSTNNRRIQLPSGIYVDGNFSGNGSGLTIHMENDKLKRFDDSYIHELAHYIMGSDHPYTDGTTSVRNKGRNAYWGIFGGGQGTNTVNAYEKELLG